MCEGIETGEKVVSGGGGKLCDRESELSGRGFCLLFRGIWIFF